jgi:hypothetical protein
MNTEEQSVLATDYSNIYYKEHEIENDIPLPLPQRSNAHIFYLVGEYPGIYQSQL